MCDDDVDDHEEEEEEWLRNWRLASLIYAMPC